MFQSKLIVVQHGQAWRVWPRNWVQLTGNDASDSNVLFPVCYLLFRCKRRDAFKTPNTKHHIVVWYYKHSYIKSQRWYNEIECQLIRILKYHRVHTIKIAFSRRKYRHKPQDSINIALANRILGPRSIHVPSLTGNKALILRFHKHDQIAKSIA